MSGNAAPCWECERLKAVITELRAEVALLREQKGILRKALRNVR